MTEFRKEALEDFVNASDGDTPPVYIGREDIFFRIETQANNTWKGPGSPRHGVGKTSTVVQGAPGAGKSVFLDELKARSTRAHLPNQSRVVIISSKDLLEGIPDVLELVGLAGGLSTEKWRRMSSNIALGVDLNAVKAEIALSWTAPDNPRPNNFLELAKRFPAAKWQGPVIVCIDEAQRLPENRYAPQTRFLQAIHDGRSSLPLSLVLGGLSDTADVVDRMGLTRVDVWEIGALTTAPDRNGYSETADLMLSFCDHFGIERSGQTDRLMGLAAPCEGWPRHLHYALQSLGREVLRTDGDLTAVNWPQIHREAADSRLKYYRIQQDGNMEDSHLLVARTMQEFRDGMVGPAVTDLIKRAVEDRPGLRLPEDMSPAGFRSHLVHRGVIHKGTDKTFRCPSPSFRSFLVRAGEPDDPDERPEQADGDVDVDFRP